MHRRPPFPTTRHKLRNLFQSLALLAGMLTLLGVCALVVWGPQGLVWAVLTGAFSLVLTPTVAPDLVMRLYRAVPLRPHDAPDLHHLLETLSRRAGLSRLPRLYYLPSPILNAFAVGTGDAAAIALTDGILRTLTSRELAGVLAHEISHIRHRDLWTMSLADLMSRLTSLMSWFGQLLLLLNLPAVLLGGVTVPWTVVLVLIFAPTAMALLQLALSRAREYDADLGAVALTGDPRGLASALAKLQRYQGAYWEEILLPGRRMPEPSLLRTHPPTEERIRRLLALEAEAEPPVLPPVRHHLPAWAAAVPHGPRWRWPGVWY
ncbi:zinc metalloprotease HtpX [Benzoatithermus flavus]|uniref:Zinc metalloprotease HtpX n=1 Tax=Benzoatithermus flavus TaxID=3108223 RepID=A0ABU8XWS8_9PROT